MKMDKEAAEKIMPLVAEIRARINSLEDLLVKAVSNGLPKGDYLAYPYGPDTIAMLANPVIDFPVRKPTE